MVTVIHHNSFALALSPSDQSAAITSSPSTSLGWWEQQRVGSEEDGCGENSDHLEEDDHDFEEFGSDCVAFALMHKICAIVVWNCSNTPTKFPANTASCTKRKTLLQKNIWHVAVCK